MVRATPTVAVASTPVRRRGGYVNKRPVGYVQKFPRVNQGGAPNPVNSAFNRKWLEENDKDKKPFSDEILATTFGKENIEKLVAAVKNATDSEVNESNRLLSDDYIYSVQITSHRSPHVPVHLSRISLPHSLENAESDICIFVKDLKRGRKLDYEPTIKHYEALLKTKKVERNITIIPINQLYNEFATFELRRKLTYLYDRFLVDKAVATHVNGFLGHKLLTKGRSAIPVDLAADNLAEEVEGALRKVFYKHVNNGITQSVQVGRHSQTDEQIGENIVELVNQLALLHPGGTQNIYKLHLKPNVNISVAVPIYVDLAKPTLETPTATGPNEKTIAAAADNASTTLENFDISQTGEVVEKVKPGKSITATGDVADADEEMNESTIAQAASTPAPKPKAKPAAKKVNKPAASTEDAINDLILKNLKKIVPQLAANNNQQNIGRVAKNQQVPVQQQQKRQQRVNQPQQQQQQVQVQSQQQQQQRQNNNQGGPNKGYVQRQNNNNQGGGPNKGYVQRQNNLGGGNNLGNPQGQNLRNNNYNNMGGNNQGYNNNRQMGAIGGGNMGGNRYAGNAGNNGGFNNMGGGNWGNSGGNNDPWGNRNQF